MTKLLRKASAKAWPVLSSGVAGGGGGGGAG